MAERPKLDDVTPDGKPRFATWAEYEVAKDEWLRTETIRELESRQAAKPKPVWDSGAFAGLVILALIGYGCWTGGSWVWHKVEKEQTTRQPPPIHAISKSSSYKLESRNSGTVTVSRHVERQNLTMRMHMRRFTRLTNGHSKKIENHCYAVALHYIYYNFCKIHQTLRVTPAMEAGLSNHAWSIEELCALVSV